MQADLAAPGPRRAACALCDLLEPPEVAATMDRVAWLLSLRALPELVDDGDWPPTPGRWSEPAGSRATPG